MVGIDGQRGCHSVDNNKPQNGFENLASKDLGLSLSDRDSKIKAGHLQGCD